MSESVKSIEGISVCPLPSAYNLAKDHPNFQPLALTPTSNDHIIPDDCCFATNIADVDEVNVQECLVPLREENVDVETALLRTARNKDGDIIEGGKLDGTYSHYVHLMKEKHHDKGRCISDSDDVILIDLFDGAEHTRSKKKVNSIISFSTSIFTPNFVKKKEVTTGSSLNILTWKQIIGTESLTVMMTAAKHYFKEKAELCSRNKNIFAYNMHDEKMLYLF